MFQIFGQEWLITVVMIIFAISGILLRVLLAAVYDKMIKETDNLTTTKNKLLKQCKVKFVNCYQLNNGVANIPVFVDKFLNRMTVGWISFDTLYYLSIQLVLLSVVAAGTGICKSIIDDRTAGEILPFYIAAFAGIYLYLTVAAAADIKDKKRVLKVNLVDYLENHLSARLKLTEQDLDRLSEKNQPTVEWMPIVGREEHPSKILPVSEEELNALLQELLSTVQS